MRERHESIQSPRTVLSPHLQIYSLPLTALLSISHRATGAILAVGFILGNLVLGLVATDPLHAETVVRFLTQVPGRLILDLLILCLNYHLVHGIRHLIWDLGFGFAKHRQQTLGRLEIMATLGLTVAMCFPAWQTASGGL